MPFRIPSTNNIIPPSIPEVGGDVIEGIFKKKRDKNYPDIWPNASESEESQIYGLDKFMAQVRRKGVAKTNKYLVIFTAIPFERELVFSLDENRGLSEDYDKSSPSKDRIYETSFLTTACENAQFPGIQYMTTDYPRYGQQVKVPYMRNFDPVTLTFRCDGDMTEKKFFDVWMSRISNTKTNDFRYMDDYVINIEIIQLDEQMRKVYGISLRRAYPSAVNAMDLSYADSNNYHRLSVTFEYEFAQQIGTIDDPRMGGESGSVTGAKSKTPFDRVKEEILKVGTGIIKEKVTKHIPVGSIPGIGNVSTISKKIFGYL